MLRHLLFWIAALGAIMAGGAQSMCRALKGPSRPAPFTVYDNTLLRDDVARVALTITGAPHTSNRIDRATLTYGDTVVEAVDIDGVDFKRYFQYEDEGRIALEIDFPPIVGASHGDKATLTLYGIFGETKEEITL